MWTEDMIRYDVREGTILVDDKIEIIKERAGFS